MQLLVACEETESIRILAHMISLVVQTKALGSLPNVRSAQKNVRMLLKKENNYNYNPVLHNNIVIRPVTYIRIYRVVNTGDQRTNL